MLHSKLNEAIKQRNATAKANHDVAMKQYEADLCVGY